MKTAATLLVAVAALSVAASPALAGKKKGKAKKKAVAAQKEESRRLCDTLGLGINLAAKSGDEAKKPAPVTFDEGKALAAAASFDLSRLGTRSSDAPTGEAAIRMEAQTLTAAQVGAVVKGHGGDLEYCWSRVPAAQRDASAFTLHLTIDARGAVTATSLGGDAPAALSSCLATTAQRWEFPTADTTSEIDYPLSFN